MKLFTIFTKILHYLPSEMSHYVALKGLKILYLTGLLKLLIKPRQYPLIKFNSLCIKKLKNKVGIAAGLDKNGDYIDCLADLGVGFIEIGTVTPRPQKGNPKPRIFRDRKQKSLINRLGFNNKGVDYLVKKLRNRNSKIIIGTSIGKNFDTPNKNAYKDYIFCLEKVYEFSDYIAVNISSPNTQDLRELSSTEYLDELLKKLKFKQHQLSLLHGYKPIFIKLSPDETSKNLKIICDSIMNNKLDGIICSNTTVDHNNKNGVGGLSGSPLKDKSTDSLIAIRSIVGNNLPIIASGGVMSVEDYQEKISAGADIVQLYTGFIFEGPKLIKDIVNINSHN